MIGRKESNQTNKQTLKFELEEKTNFVELEICRRSVNLLGILKLQISRQTLTKFLQLYKFFSDSHLLLIFRYNFFQSNINLEHMYENSFFKIYLDNLYLTL